MPSGSWGGPGSRVFTSENVVSEIWSPILSGCVLVVLSVVFVGLLLLDSLLLGPSSWAVLGALLISCAGAWLGARTYRADADWWYVVAILAVTAGALLTWAIWGIDWLRAIWPKSSFVHWFYGWPTWYKLAAQLVIAASWVAIGFVAVRLAVEIFDPGWSRRFEKDASLVGVKPNFPIGGERFPARALDAELADLREQLANAEVSTRRVQVELTNGQTTKIAELPDDPPARQFYWAVAHGSSFSVQTAIQCKCRAAFEKEIRPAFLDRGWAYWVDPDKPKAGLQLRADGWQAVARLCA